MLRNNRSRAVTTKQALMADHTITQSSPHPNYKKPISSFFDSPKFKPFTTKGFSQFDPKPFFSPKFPDIFSENKQKRSWEKLYPEGIGLALESIEENSSKPSNKKVIFSSQLTRTQISIQPISDSPTESPNANSGMKTGRLSAREMALSEDYTCVISHGPNPKTTHIFDNCIVESYSTLSRTNSPNFLNFCFTCKKNLDSKNDIYIYRGEKAFCSPECRYQEMLLDGMEK